MRGLALGGATVITLVFGLACGGVWNEAMSKAVEEKADEYVPQVAALADSPEKARVEAVLTGLKANKTQVGIVELAQLEVELKQALEDGNIDSSEADAIQAAYDEAIAPGS